MNKISNSIKHLPKISKYQAWLISTRPKTLVASFAVFALSLIFASTYSSFQFNPLLIIAIIMVCFSLQIVCNLVNDYFDFIQGVDNNHRKGPKRMLQQGILNLQEMKNGIVFTYSLTIILLIYLTYLGGTFIGIIGILSLLASYFYTGGGKLSYGYSGLGDIFAFLFFGPIATFSITFLLLNNQFLWESIWIGFTPGCFSLALITVNNLRDKNNDLIKGKKTTSVLFGATFSKIQYIISIIIAISLPIFLSIQKNNFLILLTLIAIIPSIQALKIILLQKGEPLNQALALTAKSFLIHSLLFIFTWNKNYLFIFFN